MAAAESNPGPGAAGGTRRGRRTARSHGLDVVSQGVHPDTFPVPKRTGDM